MAIRLLNQNAEVLNKSAAMNMNVNAAKGLQDVLKTNLGPKGTIKMLVGGAGDIKLTKDGNTLLKEMGVFVALPITEGVMIDTATPRSAQEKVMITSPPCTTQGFFQERSSVSCAQGIAVPPAQGSTTVIIDILGESGDNLFSHYEIPGLDASTPAKSPAGLEHIIRELTMSPPSVPGPCSDKCLHWGLHPEDPSASSDDLKLLPAQFEETELNANRHAGLANVPSFRDLLRGVRVKHLSLELLKQVKLSKPSTFLGMSALSIRDREAVLEELSCLLDMLAQKTPLDTRESDIMLLESSFDRLLLLGDGHLDLRWLDARIVKIKNSRLLQAKRVAYDKQLAQYSLLQEVAAQAIAKYKQAEVALHGMAAEIAALEGESLALGCEDSFAKDLLT